MNPDSHLPSYEHLKLRSERARPIATVRDSTAQCDDRSLDNELIARMATGDEAGLGIFYDRWSTRIHSLALRILGDADEAADVVEETFWQAWKSADRYDPERGWPGAWLVTIARARALDRLRANGRSRDRNDLLAIEHRTSSAQPPAADHDVEVAEVNIAVNSALQALPAEQRHVLELAYFGGLSHSEIARSTGQALGTVKTRVRLGMNKLRSELANFGREHRG